MSRNDLRRRALTLVWIGELWNVVEAAVALWSAVSLGSAVLMAYGLDSLIELFAGAVLIWRLGGAWQDDEDVVDRRALRLVGITFFLLAAIILLQSSAMLLGWLPRPDVSVSGIVLVLVSAVLMTVLYWGKMRVARQLQSRALRAEAKESLMCDLQDVVILVGLGLNTLMGWWWADPLAALALIPFLLKEGWESVVPDEDE
jgi:divalent metal cation (Fe/Co/Zn/Cd) transporter